MFAKVFAQIFDSSIAENYEVRHVFEDLLKLADKEGVVDMTMEAIHRRTNVPLEKVRFGIEQLLKADPVSRSKEQGGRRLVPLDSHRDWGWVIVNYQHYRSIVDEEGRRKYFRDAKQKQRKGGKAVSHNRGSAPLPGQAAATKALEDHGEGAFQQEVERQERIYDENHGNNYRRPLGNNGMGDQIPEAGERLVCSERAETVRASDGPAASEGAGVPEESADRMVLAVVCDRCHESGHKGEDCPIPMHLDGGKWVRD